MHESGAPRRSGFADVLVTDMIINKKILACEVLRTWAVSFHLPLNNKAIEETTMRKLTRNLVLAGIAGATTLCSVQALAADEPKSSPPSPRWPYIAAHAAAAGTRLHDQRGVRLELHLPRPDPDLRQAGGAGRIRLRTFKRRLCWCVGLEHQQSAIRGWQLRDRLLPRLQRQTCRRLGLDRGLLRLLLSGRELQKFRACR